MPYSTAVVIAQPGSVRWLQSVKRHVPINGRNSTKPSATSAQGMSRSSNSLTPGLSIKKPSAKWCRRPVVVVCLPRPIFERSPTVAVPPIPAPVDLFPKTAEVQLNLTTNDAAEGG